MVWSAAIVDRLSPLLVETIMIENSNRYLTRHRLNQARSQTQTQPTQDTDETYEQPTPAADVLRLPGNATTKAGKPRQRMHWSNEHNEHVMRCYYEATKLETITTGYRFDLHRHFMNKYPQLTNVTEQRLLDQKRFIIKTNKMPGEVLQRIKEEVAEKMRRDHIPINEPDHENIPNPENLDAHVEHTTLVPST